MFAAQRGLFFMRRFFSVAAIGIVFGAGAYAQSTPTCSCPTNSAALYKNFGGDSSPLLWRFEAYRKIPAGANGQLTQVICYVKQVENRSADEVRDVLWDVAGYRRDAVRPHASSPSCIDYAGEMKSAPDQGPLYHSVASSYDTAVEPPLIGWLPKKAEAVAPRTPPPLRSDFVLDTRGRDGRLMLSHVMIVSSASYDGKIGLFSFEIANEGEGPVGVFLNVRAVPEMYKDVPAAEEPFYLKAKERVIFKTALPQRPEFSPATIVIYGEDRKQAALETGGFYVPVEGKQRRSDEELWSARPARGQ
jgi:hypothetical protein